MAHSGDSHTHRCPGVEAGRYEPSTVRAMLSQDESQGTLAVGPFLGDSGATPSLKRKLMVAVRFSPERLAGKSVGSLDSSSSVPLRLCRLQPRILTTQRHHLVVRAFLMSQNGSILRPLP